MIFRSTFPNYKNEITEFPDVIKYTWGGGNGVDKTIVGQPYGSWMSYKADGVFKTKQEYMNT